ncbi:thiamine ABC transporter substrate-binding protein [Candidatus Poribacteria bacterium]|nr:MAG: thiamine ABC transporter substrate-binding protein [Candidatus Poribacteria bacterium]
MSLVTITNVTKRYDPDIILDDISVAIAPGDRIGLIGRNGCGKTTLLKIISGMLTDFKGDVVLAKGCRIGYLSQEPDLERNCTLRQEMLTVFEERLALEDKMLMLAEEMEKQEAPHLLQEYARIHEKHERLGGYDYEHQINRVLSGLGFSDQDFNLPVHVLSGGQKSRATLAKLLLEEPDLLLLDEPTNHLDINGIEWLENYLNTEYNGGVLVVSHDRYFLDKIVRKVWELAENKINIYRGNYSKYLELKNIGQLVDRRAFKIQQAFIAQEKEFIERNIAGQRTREAQGRQKKLDRLERIEKPKTDTRTLKLNFTQSTRGGDDILRCQNVGKQFGDKVLFTGLNFEVYRGDVVGIIGPNGSGKTTLFRMILGQEQPTQGNLWVGPGLRLGYYTQELEGLNPDNEILDEIWALCPDQTPFEVRSFLAKFLFSGDDVFKRIGNLSGGEQSRVQLAKLLLEKANVFLLDEPTNHLDIPAREALENALADYPATLFIISHDRFLLNRLATKLLIFDVTKEGATTRFFEGTYAEYEAEQQKQVVDTKQNQQQLKSVQSSPPPKQTKSKSKRKRKMKAQRLVGSN